MYSKSGGKVLIKSTHFIHAWFVHNEYRTCNFLIASMAYLLILFPSQFIEHAEFQTFLPIVFNEFTNVPVSSS